MVFKHPKISSSCDQGTGHMNWSFFCMLHMCDRNKHDISFFSFWIQNAIEVTCKLKRVNIKSNSMQEAMVITCTQRGFCKAFPCRPSHLCPQVPFSVWISELISSRAKHTSFHFHWQLQTESNFWNTGMHLKFHFHFSEITAVRTIQHFTMKR